MSEDAPKTRSFHAHWAAITAGLAVAVAIAGIIVAYSYRSLSHELAADMTVKNVSRGEANFASWAEVVEGEVVEYRVTVKNLGSASLSDVAITFDPPRNRSVVPVANSCWFQPSRNKPRVSCAKGWNERALQTSTLRADDAMTMFARFRVARPSCRQMLPLSNTTTADSAETPVTGGAKTTVAIDEISDVVPNRCESQRARLLYAIPPATRSKCSSWEDGSPRRDRVACYPAAGMQSATYYVFRTKRAAEAAYRGVRLGTSLTACGDWKTGHGAYEDDGRRFRFKCSNRSGGTSDLYWIEPEAHVVGAAQVDGNPDADKALAWWRSYG